MFLGDTAVSAFASQQKGPGFDSRTGRGLRIIWSLLINLQQLNVIVQM